MRIVVDHPRPGDPVGPTLVVRGWAHGPDNPVSSVEISIGEATHRALIGRPRRDVAAALDDATAVLAGFELSINVPPGDVSDLQVSAVGTDGVRTAGPVVPLTAAEGSGAAEPVAYTPQRDLRVRPRLGRRRIRLLVAARSLNRGGSQLRMAELLEALAPDRRFVVTVQSPTDGPLRTRLEAAGVDVVLGHEVAHHDPAAYAAGVASTQEWMRGRFDLVFAFTITCFAAIDAAASVGIPGIVRVGESESLATVAQWVGMPLAPEVERRGLDVIAGAQFVGFPSMTIAEKQLEAGLRGQFGLMRPGVDTYAPARARTSVSRAQARHALGVRDEARLLLFPADLWPVKGQGSLLHALFRVAPAHPDLNVALLGDGTPAYREVISGLAGTLGLESRVRIEPFTDDLTQWWRAADALVCSSESEAAPGIALEAAAYGLPLISTAVGLVPEVLERSDGGWLCSASDVSDLARILSLAASASSEELAERGRRLREYVRASHSHQVVLDDTKKLLIRIAAGRSAPQSARLS